MKKLIITIFTFLCIFTPAYSGNIEILPTMQSSSHVQDRVWVGTFQLVWNDLMDKVVHNIIKFPQGTPLMVNELNRQEFVKEELTEDCYYQYIGKVNKNTKKKIVKAIKKRFNETSDILDKFDLTPNKRKIFIYTMLKKDFQFVVPFDKLGMHGFSGDEAEFFGINENSNNNLRKGVKVLFYNSTDDCAVALNTNSKDEVFLYKTATTKPFNYIYADMLKKQNAYQGEKEFLANDELMVPNLKFFEEKSFDELSGKRIKGTQLVIDKAMETVKFEMNNTGVMLKSEAAMSIMKMSLTPPAEQRFFDFNDTFVLFLKEKGKTKPYMAIRVYDISKFQ